MIGWRRCWNGRMLHYYPTWSNSITMCSKRLVGHTGDPLAARKWKRCRKCAAMVAEQMRHVRIRAALHSVMLVVCKRCWGLGEIELGSGRWRECKVCEGVGMRSFGHRVAAAGRMEPVMACEITVSQVYERNDNAARVLCRRCRQASRCWAELGAPRELQSMLGKRARWKWWQGAAGGDSRT